MLAVDSSTKRKTHPPPRSPHPNSGPSAERAASIPIPARAVPSGASPAPRVPLLPRPLARVSLTLASPVCRLRLTSPRVPDFFRVLSIKVRLGALLNGFRFGKILIISISPPLAIHIRHKKTNSHTPIFANLVFNFKKYSKLQLFDRLADNYYSSHPDAIPGGSRPRNIQLYGCGEWGSARCKVQWQDVQINSPSSPAFQFFSISLHSPLYGAFIPSIGDYRWFAASLSESMIVPLVSYEIPDQSNFPARVAVGVHWGHAEFTPDGVDCRSGS